MKRWICVLLSLLFLPAVPLSVAGSVTCSARGAVVLEAASGIALYEKNADLQLPEASTTKIMTALLVLERADPTQKIKVSAKAAAVEGSQLGLTAGEELSVADLLYVLMMKSGNDAAVALAEGIGGSEERFVAMMNERAEKMGLKNTCFRNPHGLPDEEHYTTARDLGELTAAALENPKFRALVSTRQARLEYKDMIITNSNKLLYTCDGVFGVKTGFTKAAGRCLVSAAERQGVTLICVTLNDGNDWDDHATLYDACFARVSRREVVVQGTHRCSVPVLGGEGAAVLKNSLSLTCVTVDGIPVPYSLQEKTLPMLFAPVEECRTLGYLVLLSDKGRVLDSSPLNTIQRVEQKKEERTFAGSFLLKLRKLWRTLTSEIAS
ncbi:MAG: D-alanyl-D-alanine carboxypeptidase [Clostridia bacterium]|nr:D-alanyl-D-alanine carboxypeptidase [Clostridia bacterium]